MALGLCGPCYSKTRTKVNATKHKVWRQKNLKHSNDYVRLWNHGVTPEKFQEMFEKQNGRCIVCDEPMLLGSAAGSSKSVHIDHDHACCDGRNGRQSCGKCIRGLLCGDCNRGLGSFHDDPIVLLRAIEYLLKIRFTEEDNVQPAVSDANDQGAADIIDISEQPPEL